MTDMQGIASPTSLDALKHFLGICTLHYVGWFIYTRFFHPLKDYPDPFPASITNWWF